MVWDESGAICRDNKRHMDLGQVWNGSGVKCRRHGSGTGRVKCRRHGSGTGRVKCRRHGSGTGRVKCRRRGSGMDLKQNVGASDSEDAWIWSKMRRSVQYQ
jgi:hypothetical protein